MELILLFVLLCGVAYGQEEAIDWNDHVKIGERYKSEIACIKKFDTILKTRWIKELNEIPITDVNTFTVTPWKDKESLYTKYNSLEDEWLMEESSPIKKINECIEHIRSDLRVFGSETDCLVKLLSDNGEEEFYHQRDFKNLVKISSKEQLPFRKFISFPEVVELIFQNREPNTWTSLEALLYAHTKSYVLTDADNTSRNYIASQNCDWKNFKALQNASGEEAKLNEFMLQVRHSINKQLVGQLVKNWNLNTILSKDRYDQWVKLRKEIMSKLHMEVEMLRGQNRDVQSLCEYATELATNFTDWQSNILLTKDKSLVYLEASDVASMARTIEITLAEVNDTRHKGIMEFADRLDKGTRCLSSVVRLIENHRRYELASAFADEEFEFPEVYCENNIKNPGLLRFTFCNCIGTFCVSHYLAALFEEEYVLVKRSDGMHKIVRSGIKSKRKVKHCHTLANSSRN